MGARELGPSVTVFRVDDKLYIVDRSVEDGASARRQAGMAREKSRKEPIHIEYEPPKNPAHQEIYDLVKQRRAIETLREVFSPLRLPVDLHIKTVGCDGVSNAWYERDKSAPTIKLCYEYLQEVWQNLPKETTPAGITPRDALVGQPFFAVTHEFGHAVYDIFKIPVLGRQEDAAE